MTAQFSLFGIFCIIVLLFIFRSTIRSVTKTLPKTTSRIVQHLDKTVTVNLIEEDLELNKRLIELEDELPEKTVNADELWERFHNRPLQPTATAPSKPAPRNNRRSN